MVVKLKAKHMYAIKFTVMSYVFGKYIDVHQPLQIEKVLYPYALQVIFIWSMSNKRKLVLKEIQTRII